MKLKKGLPISLNDQVAHLLPIPTANDAKNNNNPSRKNRQSPTLDTIAGGALKSYLGGMVNGLSTGLDGNRLTFLDITPEPLERTVKNSEVPNRVSRLKALGNAVVPQQAYPVFKAIKEIDDLEE